MRIMTEVLDALKNRRSIRKFKPEQVTAQELDAVLEAGVFAPTAANKQDPVIVAVQNPETVAKLDALNAKILNMEGNSHPYYGAPTILVVLAPSDWVAATEDGSLVAGNLLNAAYAVGLGSCWIHRSKEIFDSPEGKELLKQWGLPENMMGVASIALGYPDCPHPQAAPRKAGYFVKV